MVTSPLPDRAPSRAGLGSHPAATATIEARGLHFELHDHPVLLADAQDYGTRLLAEHAPIAQGQRVLVLGAGSGLVALVAAALAGPESVAVVDSNTAAVDYARANLELNGFPGVQVFAASDLSVVAGRSFDVALANVAWYPSNGVLFAALEEAARLVVVGGLLVVAGARDRGALAAGRRLEALCGRAYALAYRKGHRIVVARRPAALGAPPRSAVEASEETTVQTVEVAGERLEIELRSGVFARGGLDDAARMLAEAIDVRATDVVLDLGCGSGLVGMVAARRARHGHVVLADADERALALARANLARNRIGNAEVVASDAYARFQGERFDLIATNPPFHAGRQQTQVVAELFMDGAPAHLRRRGRLYVVASAFLPYERRLSALFEEVALVTRDNRYKVLRATTPRTGARRLQDRARAARGTRPGGRRL